MVRTQSYVEGLMRGAAVPFGTPLRAALEVLANVYARAIAARNRRFDRDSSRSVSMGVPVISVGNLTTGGTGKTPLVIELVRRLLARGRRTAVVSRGYKARRGGAADELLVLRRRYPELICVSGPDRVMAARRAIAQGADCIIADDAFQHRRLRRDLDVVVIDATNAFGYEHLLPRGLLREPVDSLRRADLIVVSRVDQALPEALAALIARVRAVRRDLPIIYARHRAAAFRSIDNRGVVDVPAGARALCFAGIGNPESFRRTVESLGIEVVGTLWWPDHHRYRAADVMKIMNAALRVGAEWLLTTEKDAVKVVVAAQGSLAATKQAVDEYLARVLMIDKDKPVAASTDWPIPVAALRVDTEFLADGGDALDALLERVLASGG
jgi:tetraacyldisaccharide 4'-kinase